MIRMPLPPACVFLVVVLAGCSDPLPDPTKVETPTSIYTAATPPAVVLGTEGLFQLALDNILDCDSPELTAATVTWDVSSLGIKDVQVHVRDPGVAVTQAKLWVSGDITGIQKTPLWVRPGMVFDLRSKADQSLVASETVTCE